VERSLFDSHELSTYQWSIYSSAIYADCCEWHTPGFSQTFLVGGKGRQVIPVELKYLIQSEVGPMQSDHISRIKLQI
jgi:hypothetical protein